MKHPPIPSIRAFTLLEMLVTISVMAVMAALLLPGIGKTIAYADRTKCLSNLKQIGTAMSQYAQDNDGRLPGPLYTAQGAYYGTRDAYALPMKLAPYLGLPTNVVYQKASVFECPAWRKAVASDVGKVYAIQTAATMGDGTVKQPFGYPALGNYAEKPVYRVYSMESPSKTRAMWDYDAQNGGPSDRSVPLKPCHGSVRNALFFDWHVESVPLNP